MFTEHGLIWLTVQAALYPGLWSSGNIPHNIIVYCIFLYCTLYISLYVSVRLWWWGHPVTDHITSWNIAYLNIAHCILYISLYCKALMMGPPGNRPHAFLSLTRSYINTPALYSFLTNHKQMFKKKEQKNIKKNRHRRNVTSHPFFSLLWLFQPL